MNLNQSNYGEREWVKFVLIGVAIAYLSLIIFIPALNLFVQAFKNGVGPFLHNLSQPAFLHAIQLTVTIALIVVPINTIFGLCAAWVIARNQFKDENFPPQSFRCTICSLARCRRFNDCTALWATWLVWTTA